MRKQPKIETNKFERVHGKKPRGTGFWMFESSTGQIAEFKGTFGEATKRARQYMGGHTVYVMP